MKKVLVLLLAAGCNDSPLSPSPVIEQTPEPIPVANIREWAVGGAVRSLADNSPVSAGNVSWNGSSSLLGPSGAFSLVTHTAPSGSHIVTIEAPGFFTRKTRVGSLGLQSLDMIPSSSFYADYARGGLGYPTMIWSWGNPNFYIQVDDDRGERVLGLDEQAMMRDVITRSVPLFTGGTLRAGSIEFGNGPGAERMGWIRIHTVNLPGEGFAGRAHIGANPGLIYMNRGARCRGRLPSDVMGHELGHALGLWHVPGNYIMHPVLDCSQSFNGQPTATESYYSAMVYQRPRGNRAPDTDPDGPTSAVGIQGLTVVH